MADVDIECLTEADWAKAGMPTPTGEYSKKRVRLTQRLTVLLRQASRFYARQPAASRRRPRQRRRWMSAWDGLAPAARAW
jgi:hypothetical protein